MMFGDRHGATTVEMTLVGIPIIFVLISIFEISRGMWMYETTATAVREGVRFATVHGVNCVQTAGIPNQCDVTANDIVNVIWAGDGNKAGVGLTHGLQYGPTGAGAAALFDRANTIVTFSSKSGSFTCKLDGSTGGNCDAKWPPTGDDAVKNVLTISIQAPFFSALSMFWPGSSPVKFSTVNLWASSSDTVQF